MTTAIQLRREFWTLIENEAARLGMPTPLPVKVMRWKQRKTELIFDAGCATDTAIRLFASRSFEYLLRKVPSLK